MKINMESCRWMENFDGLWLCVKTNYARRICDGIDPSQKYDMEITKHKEKRSLDANAYAWVLLDKIAKESNVPKEEVYRESIRNIGGNTEIICVRDDAVEKLRDTWKRNGIGWMTDTMPSKIKGCTNVILYYGSSTFDTKQMSRFVDGIIQSCRSIGIEVLPPDKLSAMMEDWNAQKD